MFARTERLLLRPGWQEDAPALARAIGDEMIVRNLSRAPWPYTEAHARAFLGRRPEGNPSRFTMIHRPPSAQRMLGCLGMDRMETTAAEHGPCVARPHCVIAHAP